MWPRSRERGNPVAKSSESARAPPLQCGRAHVSAETAQVRPTRRPFSALQCGRAHVSAETTRCGGSRCRRRLMPSMWPRSRERGNPTDTEIWKAMDSLQCGRAHVSAETALGWDATTIYLIPSMWPRSRERGNFEEDFEREPFFRHLQCGRAHVSAETWIARSFRVPSPSLQCGRAHVSAETPSPSEYRQDVYFLQCGRAHVSAETWGMTTAALHSLIDLQCGRAHVSAETRVVAVPLPPIAQAPSMWPRSRERGNHFL